MTFEQIRVAIESHMAAWPDAPIAWDGVPASDAVKAAQDAKEPWIRLTINHGQSSTAALGSGPEVRRTGLVQVQIFTADNQGSRPAAVLADSVAEHMQYYTDGQLETLAASVQRVGPDNGWFVYLASTPFRAG